MPIQTILCFILVIFPSHSKLGIYSPQRFLQVCYLHLDLLWLDTTKFTNKACLWWNVSLGHALSCTFGAFPTIPHKDNCDFTVTLFSRFAMMLPLSPTYNFFLVYCCNIRLIMCQMKLTYIWKQGLLWIPVLKYNFDIKVFNYFVPSIISQALI